MRTHRLLATLGVAVTLGASVAACSSSTSASSSSSAAAPTAAASASPTAAATGSPNATGASLSPEIKAWCTDYYARAAKMQGSAASKETAKVAVEQIQPIKQLWETASSKGYITATELAASERVLESISNVLTLIANGSAPDSDAVTKAEDDLKAATAKDQTEVNAVTQKLRAMCGVATPSAAASTAATASPTK